jgi:hypothetical protein
MGKTELRNDGVLGSSTLCRGPSLGTSFEPPLPKGRVLVQTARDAKGDLYV